MNYRPFPRPKCPEGLCIFYSIPLPRVNVQTPYRFQSFLSQYVSLLDTKSPGERGAPRGNKTLLTTNRTFTLDGNANVSLAIGGRIGCNTDSFHVRKISRRSAGGRILQNPIQLCLEFIGNFQRLYTLFTSRSETHCMYSLSFCTYGTSSALITPASSVLARTARTLLCRSALLL